jgi:ankyrin repeat protein
MDSVVNAIILNDFDFFKREISREGANIVDLNGFTPLMICIQEKRSDMIDYLLDLGVDVNMRNCEGNTALFYAVLKSNNEIETIRKLIDCGADINIENNAEVSPLSLANSMSNATVRAFMNEVKETNATHKKENS